MPGVLPTTLHVWHMQPIQPFPLCRTCPFLLSLSGNMLVKKTVYPVWIIGLALVAVKIINRFQLAARVE